MPREIFQPNEYEKVKPYFRQPLKLVKSLESSVSHTTILYWIPPVDKNDERTCDSCKEKAEFFIYDRDHMGNLSANLFCHDHSHQSFFDYLNNVDL